MKRIFPHLWRDLQLAISILAVIGILFVGCKEKKEEVQIPKEEVAEEKALTGKKIVMIIAPQNFRDEELFEPKQILTEKGAEVKVASASLETAGGM